MLTSETWAACTPTAGANSPPPGTIVTCSGTTTNQNNPSGYGNGTQSGLTINVQPLAAVTGSISGLNINAGNAANNSGAIAGGSVGIVSTSGTLTVNNSGTVTGSAGPFNSAISGSTVNVTNSGTLFGGRAIFAANGGSKVTNSGTMTAAPGTTTNQNVPAIILSGQNNVLINSVTGLIDGAVTNSNAPITSITIDNAGTIKSLPNSTSIATIGVGQAVITNSGLITNSALPAFPSLTQLGILATDATVTNSGTISSTLSAVVATGTLSLDNSGTITSQQQNGVVGHATGAITNSGTISGIFGIQAGGASSIINSGTVIGTGGTAIQFFSKGPNSLTITPSSIINGNVVGFGSDTLRLGGSGAGTFDVSNVGASQQYRGFGAFEKTDSSTWTLTGSGAQNWTVQQGTLLVNGSMPSSSFTVSGGVLGGTGTVGSTTMNGGTLSPGNSIGTITISGNLVMTSAAAYLVEVSPSAADRTNVTGSANLAGTLALLPQSGTYTIGKQYVLLNATGGVSGTFVTSDISGLFGSSIRARLGYDANNVVLFLDPTALSPFLNAGASVNQRAVAGALDAAFSAGNVPPAFLSLFALPAASLPGALDALSGEIHPSVQSTLVEDSRYMRQAVLGRLRQAPYVGDASAMATLGLGGPRMATRTDGAVIDTGLSYQASAKKAYAADFPVKAPKLVQQAEPEYVFWGQGFGAWGHYDSDGNAAALRRNLAGFISGVDRRFGDWRLGLAGGYTHSDISVSARASSANVDSFHVAGYAGATYGAFNLRSGAAFAWHTIDTSRPIVFPGFLDQARASYDGSTAQVFGEAGYGMSYGRLAVEPFAGLAWVSARTDAFTETGGSGAAALAGTSATHDVGYSSLGVRAATSVTLANGTTLIPRAAVAWQHAFDDVTPTAALRFLSMGAGFVVAGVPLARDSALLEAGFDVAISAKATIGVSYIGQLADNVQDHAVKGKATWQF
jgi:outer membrane autotransporter protein